VAEQSPIRVLVVDDHAVVRSGIRYSLLAFEDIELVAEAANGKEALRLCSEIQPDVILMDMMMPGMDGVEATRAIADRHPQVQVIALTSFQEGNLVQEALQAGAIGYLLKDVEMDALAQAIRAAHAGRSTLAPEAAQALAKKAMQSASPGHDLTAREREVLALLVEGKSNVEIAENLAVSLSTARFHVSAIIDKLGVANRTQAATLAVRHRLVP
jgi:NarL family two-component system response regulator LiaR